MIGLQNICVTFNAGTPDEAKIFDNFSFGVNKGDFVSIIGSNGSGKTTLLNLICGSISPDSGKIVFNGKDITKMKEHRRAAFIGRVFQDPKLGTCGGLTVTENMALADGKNRPFGLAPAVNRKNIDRYRAMLEECGMGLENRMNVPAGQLSGGQRQALSLVMANMTPLDLLILDEHTAALDPHSSEQIMILTDRFVRSRGITTLMVTHNLRFAAEYGNRITLMHEGKFVLDRSDEEKRNTNIDDLLEVFNSISIESGN